MRVRYVYSACVVIETGDLTVVTDPWFTPGAYDGSWFQYPPLPRDPVDVLGPADVVYVSHIHPDHYDPAFLRAYLARHPAARVVVGETRPAYLAGRMRADGFAPEVVTRASFGRTTVEIHANALLGGGMDIDTALVVARDDLSVVNLNDNVFDQAQVDRLRAACPGGRPTFALLPYSGASLYPQSCLFPSEDEAARAAAGKRRRFLDMYGRYLAALDPVRAMPFAGKYWLGGPLAALNHRRGIPDALEAQAEHPATTVVLADGGEATFDLRTLSASATRARAYDPAEVDRHFQRLAFPGYAYETELVPAGGRALPLVPMLRAAVRNARQAAPAATAEPHWICIRPRALGRWLSFDVAQGDVRVVDDPGELTPRWEITLDDRHLFGLLTRLYHWQNAGIGAHLQYRRVPDVYDRATSHFLNFLHV